MYRPRGGRLSAARIATQQDGQEAASGHGDRGTGSCRRRCEIHNLALRLPGALLAAMLFTFQGCSGSPSEEHGGSEPPENWLVMERDGYGLMTPTFLSSSVTGDFAVLRADIAGSLADGWNTRNILCIAIDPREATAGRFGIGEGELPAFPGGIHIFNGHDSSWLTTVSGTVELEEWRTGPGGAAAGSFDIVIEDRNPEIAGARSYPVAGRFRFRLGSAAPVIPPPDPYPPGAPSLYLRKCSGCHLPGAAGANSLSWRGVLVPDIFDAGKEHHGVGLIAEEEAMLRIYLNGE